jgi:hypothetical protein
MKNIRKPSMSAILVTACGLALVVTSYSVYAQSTYKTSDAKGQAYYADQASNNQVVGETAKPPGTVAVAPSYLANKMNASDRTRKLPQELQSTANDAASSLSNARSETVELSCTSAVDNARVGVETMLEVAQKNFKAGYMEKSEYESGSKGLRGILSRLSTGECQASAGSVRSFYQCMSSQHSHVAACGQKYGYQ